MKLSTRMWAVGAAAVVGGLLLSAAPASAAPIQSASVTADPAITAYLRHLPTAKSAGPDAVTISPGVTVRHVVANLGGVPAYCDYEYVCMYDASQAVGYGGGWLLEIAKCGRFDLGKLDFPDGGKWNDRLSAVYNHQTPGTGTAFYNYSGHGTQWNFVISYAAGAYNDNFLNSGYNDIIDGIDVCSGSNTGGWTPSTPIANAHPVTKEMADQGITPVG